jgi:type IV secretory pathway VirB4 component
MPSQATRPGHRVTTRHAQALYPFTAPGGLGGRGMFVGRDSSGGAFCFDPWVLYEEGLLDDPNAIVIGKLGQGKSSLVKTLLWRMLLFGRRAFVLDVKREYGPLCEAVGVKPVSLRPGGGVRLNPLAARPEEHAQIDLLRAIATTAIGEPVTQVEAGALREALRTVRGHDQEPTLPEIARLMFDPPAEMAARLRTTPQLLATESRRAALALQDLCEGPLKGIFDGPTTPGLDLDAKLLVLDLHAVRDSPAVGILMACASAWMSALLARTAEVPGRGRLINVADESWKIVQHTGLGEWFQSNFKLARQFGVMNLVVLHKLGDLQAAGDSGSRAARIAEGLIADASTRIVYHQDESQIELTRRLLGLSSTEARLLTRLSSGQALWRVGSRSFVVQHCRSRMEARLTNTDNGMRLSTIAQTVGGRSEERPHPKGLDS